ncbi:MAG: hypothetical protein D6752_01095 [Candidatus Nitrosothermus koennekii]|nr:MAG: hypothetical protein D6752_01095 [Candidatus Nitrosothermus koennekii]
MHLDSSLIITTREERDYIMHDKILLDTDLDNDYAIIKAKILYHLSKPIDNTLLIGIDPGKRIGISILYMHEEIDSRVVTSIKALIDLITLLTENIDVRKTIVKIGSGDLRLAMKIALEIDYRLNDIDIELVDEHGTTSSITDASSRRRGVRDRLSARAIAYRRGKNFRTYILS